MANPTSNFGWQMPTPTDLVTDLPADFEVFGQAVDTSMADLKGGTSGQILAKNSNTDMDFVWIANDQGDITGITASSPLTGGGTSGDVTIGILDGTTSNKGAVQLSTSVSSTSTSLAATASAVKSAYDLANNGGPAFSAWLNGNQSLTDGVATKIAYNAELFDTDGCYDPTTNYRFTPTKAGYYQINVTTYGSSSLNTRTFARLYKNGSSYINLWDVIPPSGAVNAVFSGSGLVYMNGTSDYLEVYIRMTGTGLIAVGSLSAENQFSGVWIRS